MALRYPQHPAQHPQPQACRRYPHTADAHTRRPFLTDNGHGMVRRQFHARRLIGGNYYPVPSALYWAGPVHDVKGQALQVMCGACLPAGRPASGGAAGSAQRVGVCTLGCWVGATGSPVGLSRNRGNPPEGTPQSASPFPWILCFRVDPLGSGSGRQPSGASSRRSCSAWCRALALRARMKGPKAGGRGAGLG